MGFGMGFSLSAAVQPNPPLWSIAGLVELYLWLRADLGRVTGGGGNVGTWQDQSTNARHFTAGSNAQEAVYNAIFMGGFPALKGDGANTLLTGPSLSGITALGSADLFILMKLNLTYPVTGIGGSWQFHGGGQETYVPHAADQLIYSGDNSTARKSTGYHPSAMNVPRLYSTRSKPSSWKLYLDGVERYSTSTNTVAGTTTPALFGWSTSAGIRLDGGISEVLLFSPSLADADYALVQADIASRYGLSI